MGVPYSYTKEGKGLGRSEYEIRHAPPSYNSKFEVVEPLLHSFKAAEVAGCVTGEAFWRREARSDNSESWVICFVIAKELHRSQF
jgi:hypothetical protein